jgi:uncharacterized protein YndB with AHSA1/START domain
MRTPALILLALLLALPLCAAERRIDLDVVVAAPVDEAWTAWTTVDGVKSFFAAGANIDPRPDGAYEIYFDPTKPEGQRGADGMRILVFEPKSRLAFTWNAPEKFPNARAQRTRVTITLTPVDASHTKVSLAHDGFGESAEWIEVHAYFTKAWGEYVLPRLQKRFDAPAPAKN